MYYDYSGVDMKFEIAFFLNQLGKSTHTICTISEIWGHSKISMTEIHEISKCVLVCLD